MCAPRLLWSEGQSLSQYGPCYDQCCAQPLPSGHATWTQPGPVTRAVFLAGLPVCAITRPCLQNSPPGQAPFSNFLLIDQLKNIENLTL